MLMGVYFYFWFPPSFISSSLVGRLYMYLCACVEGF
jgi:hypothetical protein